MGRAYVVGTHDTKGVELRYVAALARAAGAQVVSVDVSTQDPDTGDLNTGRADTGRADTGRADVSAREVAAHHPDGPDAVFTGDRGTAVGAMAVALERFLAARSDVGGVLGLGGSGGTALLAPALRALPVGVGKIIVSTMASGDVAPYVGAADIAMLHSVTDVAGLNRISRRVLGNAAHALAGMVTHQVPNAADRPAVALTMFGVTTACVTAVTRRLGDAVDALVFHATGTGGRAMEKLVDDGLVGAVLDITTTEVADLIAGGVLAAGPDRLDAIARTMAPYVGSCGALDMVNFGAPDTVPPRFADRVFYQHNAQVTLMRSTPDECVAIGRFLAGKLNACAGPVRLLLPTGGVSTLDAPGGPFWDPQADEALFATLEAELTRTADRRVIRLPYHINDPEFADALVSALYEIAPHGIAPPEIAPPEIAPHGIAPLAVTPHELTPPESPP